MIKTLEKGSIIINYVCFDMTTRILPAMNIIDTPAGMMGYFNGTRLGDIFVSPVFLLEEAGIYDITLYCKTAPDYGNVVFRLNGVEIIGSLEFYSKVERFTIKKIEGIRIKDTSKVSIHGLIDSNQPDSTGFDITIGDIWIHKRN